MTTAAPGTTPPALSRTVPLMDETAVGAAGRALPSGGAGAVGTRGIATADTWSASSAATANIRISLTTFPGQRVYRACTYNVGDGSCTSGRSCLRSASSARATPASCGSRSPTAAVCRCLGRFRLVSDANAFRQTFETRISRWPAGRPPVAVRLYRVAVSRAAGLPMSPGSSRSGRRCRPTIRVAMDPRRPCRRR